MERDHLNERGTPPKVKENTDEPSSQDSGESVVQEGDEIVNQEEQTNIVNDDPSPEFLDSMNNESISPSDRNQSHVAMHGEDDEEDEDGDDDDDDDGVVIGDDPEETKRKIPVM